MRTHLAAAAFVVRAAGTLGADARLLVRIDDTNPARARHEFEAPLLEELEQVARIPLGRLGTVQGAPWVMRQSDRLSRYHEVAASLRGSGLAETLEDGSTVVRVHGEQLTVTSETTGVTVRVLRANGWPLWHFASAIDDIDAGVGVCVRGIDKYSAEPVQRAIIHALGGTAPSIYHLPKLVSADGGDRVQELLRTGLRPTTLFEYIASSLLRRNSGCTSFEQLSSAIRVHSDLRSTLQLDRRYLEKLDRQVSARPGVADQVADLLRYARLRGDTVTADYLVTHEVLTLLEAYPRPLDVHHRLVSAIAGDAFSPDVPPPQTRTAVSLLETSADAAYEHLMRSGISQPEAHRALRWVLCGLSSGPDFRTLWEWHQRNGTLRDRLAAASRTIVELTRGGTT
ncbi:glutamate--tRNA ligase family protein [Allokutzneria albata]|uniref:glutamate--tRNA ligase family protein n=1 Tax=Allokutzneria albata TaxID=211114 RepID=UPI00138E30D0|nr:glutamate--tRNA ligase family protein [Allokutzneria albata]